MDMEALRRRCDTESVWTIDLAHLLAWCGSAVKFCTLTIGANPAYFEEDFYRDQMSLDERRVNHLFEIAESSGIKVRSLFALLRALFASKGGIQKTVTEKGKITENGRLCTRG